MLTGNKNDMNTFFPVLITLIFSSLNVKISAPTAFPGSVSWAIPNWELGSHLNEFLYHQKFCRRFFEKNMNGLIKKSHFKIN